MDIEYRRGNERKITQERFKDALIEEGWEVVTVENTEKESEIKTFKRRGRPPKSEA